MKKIVSVIAVLLFTVAEACGGQPSNLLIGTWKLAGSGAAPSQYCQEPLFFAEKSRTEKDVNGTLNTAPGDLRCGRRHEVSDSLQPKMPQI